MAQTRQRSTNRDRRRRRRGRLVSIVLFVLATFGLAWFFESQATTTIIFVRHADTDTLRAGTGETGRSAEADAAAGAVEIVPPERAGGKDEAAGAPEADTVAGAPETVPPESAAEAVPPEGAVGLVPPEGVAGAVPPESAVEAAPPESTADPAPPESVAGSDRPAETGDPPLNDRGRARAELLADFLQDIDVIASVDAIYATASLRTRQTAMPLAERFDLDVEVADHYDHVGFMADVLREHKGRIVLVVTNADAIAPLVEELHGSKNVPEIGPADYDNLYIVTVPWFAKVKTLRLRYALGWERQYPLHTTRQRAVE